MASLPTLVRRLAPGAARTLRSAAGRCRPMASLSAGAALATLAEASPHVDVVRYSHKNVKWTLSKVDAYSEALAVGFVENGLRPGDAVLSWLPAHYGEEVRAWHRVGLGLGLGVGGFGLVRPSAGLLGGELYFSHPAGPAFACKNPGGKRENPKMEATQPGGPIAPAPRMQPSHCHCARRPHLTPPSLPYCSPSSSYPHPHPCPQHVLQFACSKAGLVLYNLDASQAISDPEGAKAALARALELTEASVLVSQEAGNDVSYARLVEAVVPEVRTFNFGDGMPFFSPRFPHLRLPVHTGFEVGSRPGMEPLKHLLCPADTLADQLGALPGGAGAVDGGTPLMGELTLGADGLPSMGKVLSNEEVFKAKDVWPEFTSILKKEYIEVEGGAWSSSQARPGQVKPSWVHCHGARTSRSRSRSRSRLWS